MNYQQQIDSQQEYNAKFKHDVDKELLKVNKQLDYLKSISL